MLTRDSDGGSQFFTRWVLVGDVGEEEGYDEKTYLNK